MEGKTDRPAMLRAAQSFIHKQSSSPDKKSATPMYSDAPGDRFFNDDAYSWRSIKNPHVKPHNESAISGQGNSLLE